MGLHEPGVNLKQSRLADDFQACNQEPFFMACFPSNAGHAWYAQSCLLYHCCYDESAHQVICEIVLPNLTCLACERL